MGIPVSIDPLGFTGGKLPPGYERVDSVYKDASTYWHTGLPIGSGYRVVTTFTGILKNKYNEINLFMDNSQPANNRIYYIFCGGQDFRLQPSRYVAFSSPPYILVPMQQRVHAVCEQADTGLFASVDGASLQYSGLRPISKPGTFYLGASIMLDGTLECGAELRLYSFKVYKAETKILLADYVPFRHMTAKGVEYGLYDTIERRVLPATGTPRP